ncbi:hypothetical protein CKM354_000233400 [Cercospora kikuchii]|uniref:Endonuclease/exonuclease/phosphatase domain-containing protein n=1 Tax=Cercospora kikuchii TaxID=84275 RepID=A0A9P3CA07_9PEZI|nr:uncharacterized protein CKM354_000233400 [Cercospora kikuchii]GIZ38936.1 hypothetical protein CKM354_000233400 [Cercospora kikuchii]
MDALVQRSIQLVADKKRPSVPWKLDEPWHQPYYVHDGNQWTAREAKPSDTPPSSNISKLALYSWNIDFMLPFPESRMKAGLSYLQNHITQSEDTAVAIYLQECVESDLKTVSEQPWVQQHFCISDIDISNWASGHYGTITLLSRSTPPTSLFRVHYSATKMERDVLISDISLPSPSQQQSPFTIRLCNSHLESMAFTPALRPPQVSLIASYMHQSPKISAAVAAGDFNAIQPFDKTLHSDNNLLDAYLESGGKEDDAEGHTWGQQASTALRERFGTSRMDKVYYTPPASDGQRSLKLAKFGYFGRDVVVEDRKEAEEIMTLGFENAWVTDHLGVEAVFEIVGGSQAERGEKKQGQASL